MDFRHQKSFRSFVKVELKPNDSNVCNLECCLSSKNQTIPLRNKQQTIFLILALTLIRVLLERTFLDFQKSPQSGPIYYSRQNKRDRFKIFCMNALKNYKKLIQMLALKKIPKVGFLKLGTEEVIFFIDYIIKKRVNYIQPGFFIIF